jgi:hypothetical protein
MLDIEKLLVGVGQLKPKKVSFGVVFFYRHITPLE